MLELFVHTRLQWFDGARFRVKHKPTTRLFPQKGMGIVTVFTAALFSFLITAAVTPGHAALTLGVSSNNENGPSNQPSGISVTSKNAYITAFESTASNLVGGDRNGVQDIFVFDRFSKTIHRVSVSSSGIEGSGKSFSPDISSNGRWIVFASFANNLVAGDNNGKSDIFIRDRLQNTTQKISVALGGAATNGNSFNPTVSNDGRWIAYESIASNLVSGDNNGQSDIFVYDRLNSINQIVSRASSGVESNFSSFNPSISGDGRFVAFESRASNLVFNDSNGRMDVFVHDVQGGTTERVSIDSDGNQVNGDSSNASISAGGARVVFESDADNFSAGDANGVKDIFLRDRERGFTGMVSIGVKEAVQISLFNTVRSFHPSNGSSFRPSISDDGRWVAYQSTADNLAPFARDRNSHADVFVFDTLTGVTRRLNVTDDGNEANDDSMFARISSDGLFVSYLSQADNFNCQR